MSAFFKSYWPWIVIPFVLVWGTCLALALLGSDTDGGFIYTI